MVEVLFTDGRIWLIARDTPGFNTVLDIIHYWERNAEIPNGSIFKTVTFALAKGIKSDSEIDLSVELIPFKP